LGIVITTSIEAVIAESASWGKLETTTALLRTYITTSRTMNISPASGAVLSVCGNYASYFVDNISHLWKDRPDIKRIQA
jgi:hypothetical protein